MAIVRSKKCHRVVVSLCDSYCSDGIIREVYHGLGIDWVYASNGMIELVPSTIVIVEYVFSLRK